jgi:WD40 repeat protein
VFRPGDWVYDAVFTPDGKTLVAAVRDGKLRAYDVESGRVRVVGQAKPDIEALAMSPDGKSIVSGSGVGELVLWSLADGTKKVLLDGGPSITGVQFDPNGQRVLVDREGSGLVVDLEGKREQVGPETTILLAVADKDWTKRVATLSGNQIAALTPNGTRLIAEHQRLIGFLALSPNGDTVVMQDNDALYSVPFTGGALTKLTAFEGKVNHAVWSPDGKTLVAVGVEHDVVLIDIATGKVRTLRGHTDSI